MFKMYFLETTTFNIESFLDGNRSYENCHGVSITYDEGDEVTLLCPFPGALNSPVGFRCYLYAQFESIYCFLDFYKCQSTFDLATITGQYLFDRYKKGDVEVLCYRSENKDHHLTYKRKNGDTFFTDQLVKQKQLVTQKLQHSNDFLEHAQQYFSRPNPFASGTFSLFNFLTSQDHEYVEINDLITIELLNNRTIMITCPYPGYDSRSDQILCDLQAVFETEQDFREFYPFQHEADLYQITEQYLFKKYEDGTIPVRCFLELNQQGTCLFFSKRDGMTFAFDDYYAKELSVPGKPSTGPEFVAFTLRYAVSRFEWHNE